MCLAVTAIGKDPRNVGGYNLLKKLADFENVKMAGYQRTDLGFDCARQ